MIRRAGEKDILLLMDWMRDFHAMSPYAESVPFDWVDTEETLLNMVKNENAVILFHQTGLIGGIVTPFFFNKSRTMAVETFWYAERDGKRLLKAFEEWADGMGADAVVMSSLGNDRQSTVDAIYRKLGYLPAEHQYMRIS